LAGKKVISKYLKSKIMATKKQKTGFTVKPLEWNGEIKAPYQECKAKTPFGDYDVIMLSDKTLWIFDESPFEAESVEAAKKAAEAHWQEYAKAIIDQITCSEADG
jgi:hypothetical protein